jgi:hypothetical protein
MAIRVAHCMKCGVLTLVIGLDATDADLPDRRPVWIGLHKNGDGESCTGSIGSYVKEDD